MEKLNLTTLRFEDYPSKTYDKIRYPDTDRQGHVNNSVICTFAETGRVELLYDPNPPITEPGSSFVIANLNLSFLAEFSWPGIAEIGTGISRIGNSSVNFVQGIYQNGKLCATVEAIIVHVSGSPASSSPLSEKSKEVLSKYLIKQEK